MALIGQTMISIGQAVADLSVLIAFKGAKKCEALGTLAIQGPSVRCSTVFPYSHCQNVYMLSPCATNSSTKL